MYRKLILLFLLGLIRSTAGAAVITYVGEVAGAGAAAPVTYGTDGYDLYSTSPTGTTSGFGGLGPFQYGTRLTKLPNYLTSITAPSGNYSTGGYGYATLDNP